MSVLAAEPSIADSSICDGVRQHRRQDRVRRHPALHASAADILALVADGIIVTDENGRILLFNRAAETIFGYRSEEVLGSPVQVLIPERFRNEHLSEIGKFAAGGETADRIMGHTREVAGLRKNGEEFPVEASVSRRSVERHRLLTVAVRDISERKALERQIVARTQALEDSEDRLRLALEGAAMGAWEWDFRTGKLHLDAAARRLWGLPEDGEPTVESAFQMVHREDLPNVREAVRHSTDHGIEYDREFRILHPDGGMLWVAGKAIVVRDPDGKPAKMVGVTFDITDRQEIEEQRRLLSAELNHRMKNVMSIVCQSASDRDPLSASKRDPMLV